MNLLTYKAIYFRPNSPRKLKMAAMKTLFVHLIVLINATYKNVILYCINKMTTYVSSSYSLSCVMFEYILSRMPRHSSQPVEQSNPALRQELHRVSHPIVLLHRTTFSSAFGATSMSHCTGSSLPSTTVEQALIPVSTLAPEGKHGGYGTWQRVTSEEGFQAAQNVDLSQYIVVCTVVSTIRTTASYLAWGVSHPTCSMR